LIILRVHEQSDGCRYKGLSSQSGFEGPYSLFYCYQLLVSVRSTLSVTTHKYKYCPYYTPLNVLSTCSLVLWIQMYE